MATDEPWLPRYSLMACFGAEGAKVRVSEIVSAIRKSARNSPEDLVVFVRWMMALGYWQKIIDDLVLIVFPEDVGPCATPFAEELGDLYQAAAASVAKHDSVAYTENLGAILGFMELLPRSRVLASRISISFRDLEDTPLPTWEAAIKEFGALLAAKQPAGRQLALLSILLRRAGEPGPGPSQHKAMKEIFGLLCKCGGHETAAISVLYFAKANPTSLLLPFWALSTVEDPAQVERTTLHHVKDCGTGLAEQLRQPLEYELTGAKWREVSARVPRDKHVGCGRGYEACFGLDPVNPVFPDPTTVRSLDPSASFYVPPEKMYNPSELDLLFLDYTSRSDYEAKLRKPRSGLSQTAKRRDHIRRINYADDYAEKKKKRQREEEGDESPKKKKKTRKAKPSVTE